MAGAPVAIWDPKVTLGMDMGKWNHKAEGAQLLNPVPNYGTNMPLTFLLCLSYYNLQFSLTCSQT